MSTIIEKNKYKNYKNILSNQIMLEIQKKIQIVLNMQELRECCHHEHFQRKLMEDKFKTIKRIAKKLWRFIMSFEHI